MLAIIARTANARKTCTGPLPDKKGHCNLSTFFKVFRSGDISQTVVVFCPIQVRHMSFTSRKLLTQSSNCDGSAKFASDVSLLLAFAGAQHCEVLKKWRSK